MTSSGGNASDSVLGSSSSLQHDEPQDQQQRPQGGGRSKKNKSKNRQQQQQPSTIAATVQQQQSSSRAYQTIPATIAEAATPPIPIYATITTTTADASLRPNIGLTNRYADHALFGLALHTLLDYLRLACILNATACILLALLTWFWKLVTLRLGSLILLLYLLVLSTCLLCVEVWSLFPHVLPAWNAKLQNQLGILYHPPGKACFLLVLATLCLGINGRRGFWECLLAFVYCCCSFCLIHSWCLYPELRHAYANFNTNSINNNDDASSRDGSTRFDPVFASWSDYAPSLAATWGSGSDNGDGRGTSLGERASLLYHQYQQQQGGDGNSGMYSSSSTRNNEQPSI